MRKRTDGIIPPQGGSGTVPATTPQSLPPHTELRETFVGKVERFDNLVALLHHVLATHPELAGLPWDAQYGELIVRDYEGHQVLTVTQGVTHVRM